MTIEWQEKFQFWQVCLQNINLIPVYHMLYKILMPVIKLMANYHFHKIHSFWLKAVNMKK